MLASLLKLRSLLERKDGVLLGFLFAAILVMAALEVLGIASILPFMQLVAKPGIADDMEAFVWMRETFGLPSRRALMIAVGTAVLILLTVSNAFAALTTWLQHKLTWSIAHRLSVRLVKSYASLPYEFFLTHNSADLIKKVISDVNNIVTGVLLAGSEFTARAIVSSVIFVLLIAVQPKLGILVFGIFVGVYGLIYLARHTYVTRLGREQLEVNFVRYKTFVEVLSGIKTVKTEGAEEYFIHRFESASSRFSRIHPRFQLVSTLPRYFVETLAFGGIIAIILYELVEDDGLLGALPTLSLFALAGYRLLPSLHKAFTAAALLRHNFPAIDAIYNDFQTTSLKHGPPEVATKGPIDFRNRISLAHVSFKYARGDAMVLKDVCVTISRGTKVAFVGATGSGKTTLVDLLMGLLPIQEGQLLVDDTPITPENVPRWHRELGYVPQDVFLYDDTIARNIAFGSKDDQVDLGRIRDVCRIAHLDDFIVHELSEGYQTEVGERGVRLSGGQKQRIGIARALYRQPRVLLLDEATSALDSITEKAVLRSLYKRFPELTVIVVAHRLSTVKACEQIYLLEGGRITEHGSYEELFATNSRFREMVTLAS